MVLGGWINCISPNTYYNKIVVSKFERISLKKCIRVNIFTFLSSHCEVSVDFVGLVEITFAVWGVWGYKSGTRAYPIATIPSKYNTKQKLNDFYKV